MEIFPALLWQKRDAHGRVAWRERGIATVWPRILGNGEQLQFETRSGRWTLLRSGDLDQAREINDDAARFARWHMGREPAMAALYVGHVQWSG
jgi:hypothetical protein